MRRAVIRLDMLNGDARKRPISLWQMAFTVFVLLAFAAQGFVTQTHLHGINQQELTVKLGGTVGQHPPKDGKFPGMPDEKNCPLCRLAAHTGGLVVPVLELVLPVIFLEPSSMPAPARFMVAPPLSHNWLVRAPPL